MLAIPCSRTLLASLSILGAGLATGSGSAAAQSAEWSQMRGGPAGTNSIDVEPIRSKPAASWRVPFKRIESQPVISGRNVLVVGVAPDRNERRLFVLDLDTGKRLPDAKAGEGADPQIATWNAFVVVADSKGLTILERWNGEFPSNKVRRIKGSFPNAPCIADGTIFVVDGQGALHAIDAKSGKDAVVRSNVGAGRPAVVRGKQPGTYRIGTAGIVDDGVAAGGVVLGGRSLALLVTEYPSAAEDFSTYAMLSESATPSTAGPQAYVAEVRGETASDEPTWYVFSRSPVMSSSRKPFHSVMLPKAVTPIVTDAAIVGGLAIGFSAEGDLVAAHSNGKSGLIRSHEKSFPEGALRDHVTAARDVLYFGNWAADRRTGEILWSDPALHPSSPLIPAADGIAVFVADKDLGCIAGPKGADATVAAKSARVPKGGDGIVTTDGRWIAGAVKSEAGGGFRIVAESAAESVVEQTGAALVVSGDRVLQHGPEFPVYQAFLAPIRADCLDDLAKLIADCREAGLVEMGRRLVAEARGLSKLDPRWDDLERKLSLRTVVEGPRATAPSQRLSKVEQGFRTGWAASFRSASAWCRSKDLVLCASALLCEAEALLPGNEDVRRDASTLIPAGFPDREGRDASVRWMKLAAAILPSSACVIGPEDPVWETAKREPWRPRAVALRTGHVQLVSTCVDPEIAGLCLRYAETATGILENVLPWTRLGSGATPPLNVRVHADQQEYLAQFPPDVRKEMQWTGGFYWPKDNISRFFVARDENKDPLERPIQRLLVHELTHQYIADRFARTANERMVGSPVEPGFWIVEGFARFLEDQATGFDQPGCRLDDARACSVDAAARLAEDKKLSPLGSFLDLDQEGFAKLESKPDATIELHGTLGVVRTSAKSRFYEEAGSLVFFLWNRAGEEKKKLLLDYLRDWYRSELTPGSWTRLGYAEADALQTEYERFLASVR